VELEPEPTDADWYPTLSFLVIKPYFRTPF
jgi:hypothetical protein